MITGGGDGVNFTATRLNRVAAFFNILLECGRRFCVDTAHSLASSVSRHLVLRS